MSAAPDLDRRLGPPGGVAAALALALALALVAPAAAPAGGEAVAAGKRPLKAYPWDQRVSDAARFARRRAGSASFAVVDERGRIHGFNRGRRYSSASVVKAMLLVAYLRKGSVRNGRLRGSEKATLGPMIRRSDNAAATRIHNNVGNRGLRRLARRAGMKRFIPHPVWGGSQITARDQSRFFFRIRRLIPERHRSYALGLLRRIVPGQRWGVPPARPKGWRVHFKGGWTPAAGGGWRVHQAALLRRGKRRLSVAVLTEGGPSLGYGATTITGVTRRLLRGYNGYRPVKKRPPKGGGKKRPKGIEAGARIQAGNRGGRSNPESASMTPATQNLNAKLSPRTRTARRTRAAMPATSAPGSAAGVALASSSPVRISGAAARYRGGGYRVNV